MYQTWQTALRSGGQEQQEGAQNDYSRQTDSSTENEPEQEFKERRKKKRHASL